MLTDLKDLSWSRDKEDDINVGGKYVIWMHTIFPSLRGELIYHNLFLICLLIIQCLHEMCANGIHCNYLILALGLVVLGFTNAN